MYRSLLPNQISPLFTSNHISSLKFPCFRDLGLLAPVYVQEACIERIVGANKEGLMRTARVAVGRRSPLPDATTFAGLETVGWGAGWPRPPPLVVGYLFRPRMPLRLLLTSC